MRPDQATKHDHVWSDWMPFDRNHKYRHCLHKDCMEVEKVEAKA